MRRQNFFKRFLKSATVLTALTLAAQASPPARAAAGQDNRDAGASPKPQFSVARFAREDLSAGFKKAWKDLLKRNRGLDEAVTLFYGIDLTGPLNECAQERFVQVDAKSGDFGRFLQDSLKPGSTASRQVKACARAIEDLKKIRNPKLQAALVNLWVNGAINYNHAKADSIDTKDEFRAAIFASYDWYQTPQETLGAAWGVCIDDALLKAELLSLLGHDCGITILAGSKNGWDPPTMDPQQSWHAVVFTKIGDTTWILDNQRSVPVKFPEMTSEDMRDAWACKASYIEPYEHYFARSDGITVQPIRRVEGPDRTVISHKIIKISPFTGLEHIYFLPAPKPETEFPENMDTQLRLMLDAASGEQRAVAGRVIQSAFRTHMIDPGANKYFITSKPKMPEKQKPTNLPDARLSRR